ncbi:arginine--tRNA ligase [Salibacteraceae bacterium]|nr:arginine--tRNA ligase [Salibacteraceae bacterium]
MEEELRSALAESIERLYGAFEGDLQIQKTRKEFEGEFTLVVFPLLRTSKKKPEETAEEIGRDLVENFEAAVAFQVVKGFLNISLSDKRWLKFLNDLMGDPRHGHKPKDNRQIMVEYSSPNTNKPLHLGHIRNNLLGYSVARLLEASGRKVEKVQIINDRGIHICKSMLAWQKFGDGETPESSGMKGDHLVGKYYVRFDQEYKKEISVLIAGGTDAKEAEKQAPILLEAQSMLVKWEAKDPEVYALWERMNSWVYTGFDATYKRMGVTFDQLYYESETYLVGKEKIQEGLDKGVFFKKEDGSVWIDLTEDGLDQKILLRSDGTAVYMTQDIGTAILRFEEYPELSKLIYTVGNEQNYHFKVLFLILKKLGYAWAEECEHLSYGMVTLPEGKMKSREGTVVDADELMAEMVQTAQEKTEELGKLEGMAEDEKADLYEQIGLASLKYFILKVDPKKEIMFNPAESIDFNGNTGPFLQYAFVRIRSVAKKAGSFGQKGWADIKLDDRERNILKVLYAYADTLEEAAQQLNPALIANHCYELVKTYNTFYQNLPIVNDDDEVLTSFRLSLSLKVGEVIESSLGLLGIEVPEKM